MYWDILIFAMGYTKDVKYSNQKNYFKEIFQVSKYSF
jgi:hypothetical protein